MSYKLYSAKVLRHVAESIYAFDEDDESYAHALANILADKVQSSILAKLKATKYGDVVRRAIQEAQE